MITAHSIVVSIYGFIDEYNPKQMWKLLGPAFCAVPMKSTQKSHAKLRIAREADGWPWTSVEFRFLSSSSANMSWNELQLI